MRKHITLFVALLLALCGYAQNKNSAYPSDFGTSVVLKGKTVKVLITITNTGANVINNLTYELTSDGDNLERKMVKFNTAVKSGESVQVPLTFKADTECRKSVKEFTVTRLNSVANASKQKTATGAVVTISEKPVVTPLVEEYTGTWCGWCPVGFDGMERAHEAYGQTVSLIAIHSGDVMEASEFQNLVNRVGGFPSAFIDRGDEDIYPTAGELKKQINNDITNKIAAGTIQVSASWANAARSAIKINTKTIFVYSDDNANYGIGFVLTQDGMKGSGSSWAQANNLSHNSNYSSIPFWYNAPSRVTGIEFNHVGVAAWGLESGLKGSVSPTFQASEELAYSYNASIAGKTLIQDKNKLNVIALLIDRSTGAIVNTAQTTIEDYTTGIESINNEQLINNNEQSDGAVYDLSGRKVNSQLKKGLYIQNGKKFIKK